MSKITQLNEKAISIPIARRYKEAMISKGKLCILYNYGGHLDGMEFDPETDEIDLPPGSWSILGRPEEMALEKCYKVMEGYDGSLYTLLKSKGLQDKSVIILIKQ